MSSDSQSISAARFAAALPALSLESLRAKAVEIRNSRTGMKTATSEMVIERMVNRIELLKTEVEGRGMRWVEEEQDGTEKNGESAGEDGGIDGVEAHRNGSGGVTAVGTADSTRTAPAASGRLTDEELRRILTERMGDGDEDGVHL